MNGITYREEGITALEEAEIMIAQGGHLTGRTKQKTRELQYKLTQKSVIHQSHGEQVGPAHSQQESRTRQKTTLSSHERTCHAGVHIDRS